METYTEENMILVFIGGWCSEAARVIDKSLGWLFEDENSLHVPKCPKKVLLCNEVLFVFVTWNQICLKLFNAATICTAVRVMVGNTDNRVRFTHLSANRMA